MGVSVYLASPFFSKTENVFKQKVKNHLERLGYNIIDPQTPTLEHGWELPMHEWGKRTFENDIQAISKADMIVAIDWGMYSDTGTAWEIGYAYGKQIPAIVVIPNSVLNQKHSLMVAHGSTHYITEKRFFLTQSTEELFQDHNALGIVVS